MAGALFLILTLTAGGGGAAAQGPALSIRMAGLSQPVEIRRDRWGINHIYAQNEADLFFAQGYAAAKDRLFQFEMWRRQATGTVAEILGPREVRRDQGARLHLFRGDLDDELNRYHPRGKLIVESYVRGRQRLRRRNRAGRRVAAHGVQDARASRPGAGRRRW